MLERLKEKLDIKESIVYGSSDAICDVIVPDNDFNSIVKSIHNEYEEDRIQMDFFICIRNSHD